MRPTKACACCAPASMAALLSWFIPRTRRPRFRSCSMKRELREVMRQLEEMERALRDGEMCVLTLGREIKDLSALLDRLEGEKREAEHQAMTSGHMLQQLESEMARIGERLGVSQSELRRLASDRADPQTIVVTRQAEIAAMEEQRVQIEQTIAAPQQSLPMLRQRREDASHISSHPAARSATLQD